MAQCECGCEEETVSGNFRPGHDQKLRTSLERRVGGLMALRDLVESAEALSAGDLSEESHTSQVRTIMNSVG
ncbi:hypothetical protein HWV01_08070 [Moritella sp. 5]|uniref:hypothetical protein n=1 Tax=Moritella sp. 5 TaxID=2746231 RepID=UPI001BAA08EE|nr:hypothetical protein [Moritella sp. 5]QUM80245.1 hypothetical protein HWV01_08070 [Moritella sp. 5]